MMGQSPHKGSSRVAPQVEDLCRHLLSARREDDVSGHVNASMRLLSSTLPVRNQDDTKVIQQLLQGLTNEGRSTENARLSAAYGRLVSLNHELLGPSLQFLHRLYTVRNTDVPRREYIPVRSRIDNKDVQARPTVDATTERLSRILIGRSQPPASKSSGQTTSALPAVPINTAAQVTEAELVREVLYVLQGIDGTFIKYDPRQARYVISDKVDPRSWDPLLQSILPCADMYKRVENAVSRLEAMKNSGQTVRTLAQALRSELAEHYHVIAGLNDQQGQLSVWRLNVWVDEPYFRLLGLARMADACLQAGVQGGALLSILHKQCKTGSTMDRQLCSDILVKISEPFFAMLKAWVFDGELRDPFNEFFIEESDMDQQSPETSVWEGRFQLDETKTPVFIHADTARKALLIGKTIHFMRTCCKDFAPLRSERTRAGYQQNFTYGEREGLGAVLGVMQGVVSGGLVTVLHNKFHLGDHLAALHAYLLLGHGDFSRRLMLELMGELETSGSSIQQHRLNLALEEAKSATTGRQDPNHVLDAVHITMEQPMANDLGWDVVMLDYVIGAPLNAVISEVAVRKYKQVFMAMWRLQRLEYSLTSVWHTTTTSAIHIFARAFRDTPDVDRVVRKCCAVQQPMLAFVQRMQSFVGDVVTREWAGFMKALASARDVDEIINAQHKFLNDVLKGTLLGHEKDAKTMAQLLEGIAKTVLAFTATSTRFLEAANNEAKDRVRYLQQIHANTEHGNWGETSRMSAADKMRRSDFQYGVLAKAGRDLDAHKATFIRHTRELVSKLRAYGHGEPELQYLAEQIDFNDFFSKHTPLSS